MKRGPRLGSIQEIRVKLTRLIVCVTVVLVPVAATMAAPLFTDNFNGGTASPQWGNEIGNWIVTNDQYHADSPSNTPPTVSSLPPVLTDFTIDVDVIDIQDGGVWLRTEFDATSGEARNGVLLVTGGNRGNGTGFYWHTVTAGSYQGPFSPSAAGLLNPGVSDVHLRLRVEGDTYEVFLDNSPTPATTLTTSAYPSGQVGLYDFSNQRFDNFALTPEPTTLTFLALGALAVIRRRRR